MQALTDAHPKCLVQWRGQPLLHWQLQALRSAGVSEIGIVTGYQREKLQPWGLTEFHNPRWAETNMVSSLECAQDWLRAAPCIVCYSDLFYEAEAIRSLMASSADLAVTYDPHWRNLWEKRFSNPLVDAETFRLSPSQQLSEIGGKPRSIDEIEGQYMGLLRFTPAGWMEVGRIRAALAPEQRDKMHMTGTLQCVIQAARMPIQALRYEGQWGEFDSASDLVELA